MRKIFLFCLLTIAVLNSCQEKDHSKSIKTYEDYYVDPSEWVEGRVCDKLLWKCLPESNNTKLWALSLENNLENFDLTHKVNTKYEKIVKRWHNEYFNNQKEADVKSNALDDAFYEKVEQKRFLVKMEQSLEKEFPDFWREVPKKVRYRWIQRAMNKAKMFGDKPKNNNLMVELCARIGLNFDKNPKWEEITKFVAKDPRNNTGTAVRYLDFTVFEKNYDRHGNKFTDWSLRDAFPDLPVPKRPLPKLNEQ